MRQTTLNFRPYTSSDRDSCLHVFRTNIPKYFREHEIAEFTSSIDAMNYPYFVVEESRSVVGCGGFGVQKDGDTADLCWGMVDLSFHGQYIGEYLLLARLNEIVAIDGVIAVRLGTSQYTDGFFQRHGFEVLERRENEIADGLDHVEMRLALTLSRREQIQSAWQACCLRFAK